MIPKKELQRLKPDFQAMAEIAAQTGLSYFKLSFRNKSYNGKAWPEAKADKAGTRRRGSLMVQSAALVNSLRIAETTPNQIKWSAGNDKVPYAQAHNEGGKAGREAGFAMPQRQFVGESDELEKRITQQLNSYMKKIFK